MKYSIALPVVASLVGMAAAAKQPTQLHLSGHIDPSQVMTFVYAPFTVPVGVTSIYVLQNYTMKGQGNSLDLGCFDQRGTQLADPVNGTTGFRGWSGGFRNNFTISAAGATPGYNPGAIEPGQWNVALGPYASVPQGIDWTLDITMGYGNVGPDFTPAFAQVDMNPSCSGCQETTDFKWYRGDFHMHTVYSDGRYTPDQQLQNALSQGLDFAFLSDHNTDTSNLVAGAYQRQYAPNLMVGRAIEVTTRSGHWQAVGLDRDQIIEWRYTPQGNSPGYAAAGYAAATDQVHKAGGFTSVNHPYANCPACNWSLDWDHNDAIEVWNSVWDPADQQSVDQWQSQLVAGKIVTAIGGSDSHSPPSINGLPTTVVKARGRSQAAIVQGVRAARAYLVEGPGMDIAFEVQDRSLPAPAQIGDKLSTSSNGATAVFTGTGFTGQKACFVNENGYFYNTSIVDGTPISQSVPASSKFVRVEVRNATTTDDMLGLTNPVWFFG